MRNVYEELRRTQRQNKQARWIYGTGIVINLFGAVFALVWSDEVNPWLPAGVALVFIILFAFNERMIRDLRRYE